MTIQIKKMETGAFQAVMQKLRESGETVEIVRLNLNNGPENKQDTAYGAEILKKRAVYQPNTDDKIINPVLNKPFSKK